MRSPLARRGMSLIELLISIALATMIVAVVAQVTTQVQRTINATQLREDVARNARALFTDIEQDLSRMIPGATAPAPFDKLTSPYAPRPLCIEAGGASRDAASDKLRVLASVNSPDGKNELVRGLIEYDLDAPLPARGTLPSARVRRRIVQWAATGATTLQAGPLPYALADRATAFQLEWLPSGSTFQDPTAATKDGSAFAREGKLDLAPDTQDPFTAKAADAAGGALLADIPVGRELKLFLARANEVATKDMAVPATTLLVRRKLSDSGGTFVRLSDRLDKLTGVPAQAFVPPTSIRVTVTFVFGQGLEPGTARFSRTFLVPR